MSALEMYHVAKRQSTGWDAFGQTPAPRQGRACLKSTDQAAPPPGSVFRKNPDVIFRQVGDEALLVPVAGNVGDLASIYTMNETAAWLWERVDGIKSVEELIRLASDEYDVSEETARQDVLEFVDQLSSIGFLQRV